MKFSFVVLHYNQLEQVSNYVIPSITEALDGVYEFDIAIIDDGSDNYTELTKLSSDNIKVMQSPVRRNQSLMRNMGVDNTNGDIIWYIDGDDWYGVSALRRACEFIINNPNHDIYYSSIARTNIRGKGGVKIINFPTGDISRPPTGTMQYCISRQYKDRLGLRWEETTFNWDSEDLFYWWLALGNTNNHVCIPYTGPIGYRPLYRGGNSDRSGDVKLSYLLYLMGLICDTESRINNPIMLDYMRNQRMIAEGRYRKMVGYSKLPKSVCSRIDSKLADAYSPRLPATSMRLNLV